jgi:hypothetical protein
MPVIHILRVLVLFVQSVQLVNQTLGKLLYLCNRLLLNRRFYNFLLCNLLPHVSLCE